MPADWLRRVPLGRQGIELIGSGETLPVGRDHLSFLAHVQEFDALQSQLIRNVPMDPGQGDILFKTIAFEVNHAGSQVRNGGMQLTEAGVPFANAT